ncbi:WXG100 family type VII secretion target [Streptomyces sp. NPDC006602]|uniref:WXG100 family type VII secretion target n=1 Tax=Streptomyces sp. NPDC006602 TaxID=3364751 RepID=UPI00367AA71D
MGYGGYYNAEYYEAQQQAQQQRIKDKHDEKLESTKDGGMGGPDRSKLDTPFMQMGIPELRSMILDADPGRIYEVSQHWKSVHNILSGGDGDPKVGGVDSVSAKDSVAGMMQSAVENVLEHWEGDAAEAFRKKANEIMQNVRNGAAWANYYGESMHSVQNDLRTSMDKMRDVEEPSGWDRAWDKLTDDNRSDEQLLADINRGVSTDAARQANADSLSAGKEKQLEGVAIMEQLGVNYKAYAKMQPPIDDPEPFPAPNPTTPMPTPISMPSAASSRPGSGSSTIKPWSAGSTTSIKPTPTTPTTPRAPGITGGSQLPTTRTNVDSISPGLTGTGPSTGVGGPSVGGGNFGTSGAQGSGIVTPGGTSGLAGGAAAARGGIGAAGSRTGGGAAAGRGAGGRSGMGGMGGGGAGAAGRGGAGAGGRGALARSRGGVVGAAKGVTGKGAGGGAGLHGSRGGSQRGAMAGGAGGASGRGRRSEEENSQGDRPDYLVEDEETWISEEDRNRNVPRTIE